MGLLDFTWKKHEDVKAELAEDEKKLLKLITEDLVKAESIVKKLKTVQKVVVNLNNKSTDTKKSDLKIIEGLHSELQMIDKEEKDQNIQQELMFLSYIKELLEKN